MSFAFEVVIILFRGQDVVCVYLALPSPPSSEQGAIDFPRAAAVVAAKLPGRRRCTTRRYDVNGRAINDNDSGKPLPEIEYNTDLHGVRAKTTKYVLYGRRTSNLCAKGSEVANAVRAKVIYENLNIFFFSKFKHNGNGKTMYIHI